MHLGGLIFSLFPRKAAHENPGLLPGKVLTSNAGQARTVK
jgi:hypothetical protein